MGVDVAVVDVAVVEAAVVEAAAVVTLRWPERRNALGPADAREVSAALAEAGRVAPAVIVLAGEGAFCAGGDLPTFAEMSRTRTTNEIEHEVYESVQSMVRALRDAPVPTIAAVDGPAVGLGMDLALACDMRFVGPDGFLQQGWARVGLVAGTGGVGLLHRLAPGLVWGLLAEQPRLDAAACARLGLADDTASDLPYAGDARGSKGPATRALEAALARAAALARVPRDVLGHYAGLDRGAAWPSDDAFVASAQIQARLLTAPRFADSVDQVLGR